MASQPNILDPSQLQSVIGWLEEQHRQDRQEIARLGSEVDRLAATLRDQAEQLLALRASVEEGRTVVERVPIVDEAIKQTREQVAGLITRFDEHAQRSTQTLLLRAADAERDRKVLGDLSQTVARLEHEDRQLAARLQVVADEGRRDRAVALELPKAIEQLQSRLHVVAHRADQIEEVAKRAESTAHQQRDELEAIRTEQARAAQWRQLTDLRWTRQVAEWQSAIDNWRQAAEEQGRPVQHLLQQVAQARDEVRATQGALADQARRLDDAIAATSRVDAAVAQQREAIGRMEAALDAQRRRFDEQASAQLRLDEAVGRVVEQRMASDRAREEQFRQIDELRTQLRATEQELSRARRELAEGQAALEGEAANLRALANEAIERLDAVARRLDARITELSRLLQAQRQRTVVDLEHQMRELDDLLNRSDPA
jgi:chromosome segregation ATPase